MMIYSCNNGDICDSDMLEKLTDRKYLILTLTIMFVMMYVYYYVYKKYKQNHRITLDKEMYEKLLIKKLD